MYMIWYVCVYVESVCHLDQNMNLPRTHKCSIHATRNIHLGDIDIYACVCRHRHSEKNYFIRIRKKKKTLPHYIMNMKQMESAARLSVCMSGLVVCIPYAQPSPSLQLPRQDNITTRSESVFCCSFWSTTTKNGCVHTIFAHLSICYNTKFVEEGIGIVHGKTFWGGATIFCRPNLIVCRTDFSCFSAVAVQLCVPCALPAL